MRYEGHITIRRSENARELTRQIREVGEKYGMHYSEIAGWDETGTGHNTFLTTHSDDLDTIIDTMQEAAWDLRRLDAAVKRIKVEDCVFDERYT